MTDNIIHKYKTDSLTPDELQQIMWQIESMAIVYISSMI